MLKKENLEHQLNMKIHYITSVGQLAFKSTNGVSKSLPVVESKNFSLSKSQFSVPFLPLYSESVIILWWLSSGSNKMPT